MIGGGIDALLEEGRVCIHDISGCFSMSYYKEQRPGPMHSRYGGRLGSRRFPRECDPPSGCCRPGTGSCGDVQIIVADKAIRPPGTARIIRYPLSRIVLSMLKARPAVRTSSEHFGYNADALSAGRYGGL